MKEYKNTFSRDYAVSEVVGGIILVLMAVAAFSAIYMYLFPPVPDMHSYVTIAGDVNDEGLIVLYHKGGKTLTDYNIIVRAYPDGDLIGSAEIKDDDWGINENRSVFELIKVYDIKLINETDEIEVEVYNTNKDGSQDQVFSRVLSGTSRFSIPPDFKGEYMLISSLRTNTTSEDLICFTGNINASINASTHIYSWRLNGLPLAEFLMPFNTNSSTITMDYSGHGNDGDVKDCIWIENGVVGGAYHFGGSKDYVVIEANLSDCFNDLYRNSFTISIWVNCIQMEDDNKIILEVRKDTQNFVRLFQESNAFHFGVCVDGTKYSVKTQAAVSNTWYHIAAVWNPSDDYMAIYIDGVKCTLPGSATFSCGAHTGISLGHGNSGSGGYWFGYLDEVQIYDRVLSEDQICQIYLAQKTGLSDKEVIVSQEINEGEIWQCIVYPNDGTQDGDPIESNFLQIIEYTGRD